MVRRAKQMLKPRDALKNYPWPRQRLCEMACKARGEAHGSSMGEPRNAAGRSQSLVLQGLRPHRAIAASEGSVRSYGYDLHHLSCNLPDGRSNATCV